MILPQPREVREGFLEEGATESGRMESDGRHCSAAQYAAGRPEMRFGRWLRGLQAS